MSDNWTARDFLLDSILALTFSLMHAGEGCVRTLATRQTPKWSVQPTGSAKT